MKLAIFSVPVIGLLCTGLATNTWSSTVVYGAPSPAVSNGRQQHNHHHDGGAGRNPTTITATTTAATTMLRAPTAVITTSAGTPTSSAAAPAAATTTTTTTTTRQLGELEPEEECMDRFDPQDCDLLSKTFDDASSNSVSRSFVLLSGGRNSSSNKNGEPGSPCKDSSQCKNDFTCHQERCLPGTDSCLGKAISNFTEVFDFDTWTSIVLDKASVSHADDLKKESGNSFANFKKTELLQALISATQNNIPDEFYDLQTAVNKCDKNAATSAQATGTTSTEGITDAVTTESRAPTTPGTIVYMGLHFELSVLADIAASVFWALGEDNPEPTGFVRGTFGAELGLGAEASALLGFAFTSTTGNIQEGAIVTDIDAGLGPHIGMAVVANLNGLVSLEFTLGAGAGGGLGIGYSITTSAINPTTAPTIMPTSRPTIMPTSRPTIMPTSRPTAKPCLTVFPNRDDLDEAIDAGTSNGFANPEKDPFQTWGPIEDWCFDSSLQDFSELFRQKPNFDEDISGWDVAAVTDMSVSLKKEILCVL